MRLYANENFPLPVVVALRKLGHDVLTTRDTNQDNQRMPDKDVLAFALQDGRAILTLNRKHFIRLHSQQPNYKGIVVCSFDPDFDAQSQRIYDAVNKHDTLDGQLIRVNRGS